MAVGALLATTGVSTATATSAASAAPAPDPCAERPATALDQRGDWQCVGLATIADANAQPETPTLTEEQATQLDVARPVNYELGVAISPDGRLYRQTTPPPAGPVETRPSEAGGAEDEGEPRPARPVETRTIFGADDRTRRAATTSYPWRAMGSILAPNATTSNCSGALIGPRHFLTAGHCIHQGGGGSGQGWYTNRKVAPGQNGINSFPNGLKNHAWYFSVSGWFDHADPAYDYGMIVLEDRADTANLGWLGWRSTGHTGAHWTFGYPGWSYTCAASPSPSKRCDNYLYGDDNSPFLLTTNQIGTQADIQSGQSGSPIYKYNNGDRRVIGIVAYHGNWGTRVTSARSANFCNWIRVSPSAFNDHPCE
ncbi:hypothetical protein BU204_02795 [Actinophytocola xanthii]|uniref:Serine protease n=2 Tax=Actinophytocola xanthii TaxID=1912961 RepID=A0A1Q8CY66_9PSEU|nr:hypothetical protein BU204_02795 [Actinophytocola xanthii]